MKALFDRLFGRTRESESAPPPAPEAPSEAAADPVEELRDKIRRDVAAGFDDEDVILTNVADYFEEEIDPALVRREAPRILREVLADHAEAEKSWPAVTDCDRLDAAFAALEHDGIIARQNFTCCMTCGSNEIWEEVQAARDAGLPAHGYAFYHFQDTDAAVEGHGVYLAYGACEEGEAPALQVANDIVAALQAQGLSPAWGGRWDQRIPVPLDWKRRRGVPGPLG
ncbi:DUF6891 domain-containing protein [Sphingomonas sp. S2-65]|uniref:DUF6891 domain-containing protein n=1 Tax=Sphingomonas sp. S2-65 TaxID=2903960 RepID=UPI001F1A3B09|nr:hypothetical protein [Sphingomonas sp. S2-65]UYY57782.1 hypothetical protein LZ586_14095 [Sphingomonas sp. S2-65]